MSSSEEASIEVVYILQDASSSECDRKYKLYALSDTDSSSDVVVFDSKLVRAATVAGDLASLCDDQSSEQRYTKLERRRAQSWSFGLPDEISSDVRILRERLLRTQTWPRPGAVRNLNKRQKLTLVSLAIADFMSFCSISIMAPFFPREAADKSLSEIMCGLIFSFYAVVMFLTAPFFGYFLPKVGAKSMFISGIFIAGVFNVCFGFLVLIEDVTTFTILCFVVRGLGALGASAFSTASYVFIINAFPNSIGIVLGILETFVGLGMSLGPAIGGLLYSIGGFGLPFFVLGVAMVVTVPLNFFLLDNNKNMDEFLSSTKSGSILQLFKVPSIIVTGLIIVVISNTWAFLDPILEPHLRQFDLSTGQIGLIFLLYSGLYGIFSPIWGWVADRVHNHWCMMIWGMFLSTGSLLLLGPSPFISGLPHELWLDLVALSMLGISVALTLIPTFQGVLTSSIYDGGCPEGLATYSAVAGVWSCCYSLGEAIGPALGGVLAQRGGFPLTATLCAAATAIMGVIALIFFSIRESTKTLEACDSMSNTDTTWDSTWVEEAENLTDKEDSPLMQSYCSCSLKIDSFEESPYRCLLHSSNNVTKNKSCISGISNAVVYFLKFQYITNLIIKMRRQKPLPTLPNTDLYQNYLEKEQDIRNRSNTKQEPLDIRYADLLEDSMLKTKNKENFKKKLTLTNSTSLLPRLELSREEFDKKEPSSLDILNINLNKAVYYEKQ